ncbi:MAG: DNA/RNA non-specific endonuclease [Candidatus Eremiobacteraeota bacterium]|nr:DNA/RNA non-specific endonuclease [Candidatus Eremiobacteraeota bacterium]
MSSEIGKIFTPDQHNILPQSVHTQGAEKTLSPAVKELEKDGELKETKKENVITDHLELGGKTPGADETGEILISKINKHAPSCEFRTGYDNSFIGPDFKVPLPEVTGPAKDKVLPVSIYGEKVRNYTHFSVVMNKDRKLAFFTAHNVDGKTLQSGIKRIGWKIDDTIGDENQLGNEIYKNNDLDRGHMVRRIAVAWGERGEAKRASDDSFYYPNAAPQHARLNQKTWLSLENWLLENADQNDNKLCVFTGPVFRENDKVYRGEKIPADFWKIIILKRKTDGKLAAAGFMMSQKKLLEGIGNKKHELDKEDVETPQIAPYQVSLSTIEELTSLDFGELKEVDAYSLYRSQKPKIYRSSAQGPLMQEDIQEIPHNSIHSKEDIII